MKLSELLASEKTGPILRPLFKAQNGRLTAIRLRKDEVIKEHKSPVPAMLLVLEGAVRYEEPGTGVSRRLSALEYTEIPPDIIHQVVQVVHHSQFASGLIGVMDSSQVGHKSELELLIIVQEIQHFEILLFGSFKTKHTVRFFEGRNLLPEFLGQPLFDYFISH